MNGLDDFILYGGTNLFYDADGIGTGAAIQIANFAHNLALDPIDFIIM